MSRATWFLLAAVVILTACTSTQSTPTPEADFFVGPDQAFLLRVGDTAGVVIPTAVVLVRFGGVLADSRCPVDVTCVQAGAATLLFSVQTTLSIQEVQLDVPPGGTAEVGVEEVTLRTSELRPEAQEGVTIRAIDYQVVMRVSVTGDLPSP